MKKLSYILLIFILIITLAFIPVAVMYEGGWVAPIDAEIVSAPQSEILTPQTPSITTSETSENVVPPYPWAQAFYDELGDDFFHFRMRLIDVDFDGVPVLFFVTSGAGPNMWIAYGLVYRNGEVFEIEFDNEFGRIPGELSLLRNVHTGEKVWLAYGRFSSMAGAQQSFRYYFVDFLNLPQVRAEQVLAHDLDPIFNEEEDEILEFVHTRRLQNGESVQTSLVEIDQLREEIFADFEEVGVQIFNRQEGKFVTDYRNGHNREQEWRALILMLSERE